MQQEQRDLLQTLYVKHRKVLRDAAKKYGLPEEEADDAVQDIFCAFIDAYLKCAGVWNENQVKATLMKMMRNRCMDYYRRSKRHPGVSLEELVQEGKYVIASELMAVDVSKRMILQEEMIQLKEAIMSMSREMQDVVVLYMLEDRPVEEVCGILNISETACRVRISRIRKYLSECLNYSEEVKPKRRGRPKSSRKTKLSAALEPFLGEEYPDGIEGA